MKKQIDPIEQVRFQTSHSVSDQLYDRICSLILSGELPSGYVFPNETVMCQKLGVGRTSLREAYKALELSGYITRTKRGTYVNERSTILNASPMKTLFDAASEKDFNRFRLMIESESVWQAAANKNQEALAQLEALNQTIADSYERGDYRLLMETDIKFHQAISQMSENALIHSVVMIMTDHLLTSIEQNFAQAIAERSDRMGLIAQQHALIIEGIKNGDPEQARQAMEKHLLSMTK